MSAIKNKQFKQYEQFKQEYIAYLDSDTYTVTDLWKKVKSFIIYFNPDTYPINEISKRRVKSLSNSLRNSFRELNEKKGVEDTRPIETRIDGFYQEINELFKTIFEEATPQICLKEGVDPSQMFILQKEVNNDSNDDSDICNLLKNIKEYRQKVLMRKMSIKELFNTIADPFFNFLSIPNNERKIGEINSNALNLLLTNFSGKLKEYDDALGIGNNSQANLLLTESLMVVKKIIDKLEEICDK